jgi:spore germination protein KC
MMLYFRLARPIMTWILCAALLAGCWNRREMNTLAIAIAVGLDKVGEQINVSVQVVNPNKVSSQQSGYDGHSQVAMFQETADTVFEALRKITTVAPRKIYLSHLNVLVIGESLAREGILESIELFYRDQELRTDFFVAVTKNCSAEDALKIYTSLDNMPARRLHHSLETSEKVWAPTKTVTMDELMDNLVSEGKETVLTAIELTGSKEIGEKLENVEFIDSPVRLRYSGLAVFRGERLIGWFDEEESKGFNYIIDNVSSTVGFNRCGKKGKVVMEVIRSRTRMKGEIKEGNPAVRLNVRLELNIAALSCPIDLTDPAIIREQQEKAEKEVERFVKKTIEKAQKTFHSDLFGFGQEIYRSNPKHWERFKTDWNERFSSMETQVEVHASIRNIGVITKEMEAEG